MIQARKGQEEEQSSAPPRCDLPTAGKRTLMSQLHVPVPACLLGHEMSAHLGAPQTSSSTFKRHTRLTFCSYLNHPYTFHSSIPSEHHTTLANMSGRVLRLGGVAAAAGVGYYLYQAGGDPKAAEKRFEGMHSSHLTTDSSKKLTRLTLTQPTRPSSRTKRKSSSPAAPTKRRRMPRSRRPTSPPKPTS